MELDYLPIDTENIEYRPDKFAIDLSGTRLIFRISWNPVAEGFFFDLFNDEGDPIVYGRRIVYGENMLDISNEKIPDNVLIYPFDVTGEDEKERITFDNFMNNVKPYIFVGDN